MGSFIFTCGSSLYQEKEKLYMELKHIIARHPGPEAAEQLQIYRHTLREKTKQLKVSSGSVQIKGQPQSGKMTEILPLSWHYKPISQWHNPERSAFEKFWSQKGQGKPQSYSFAPTPPSIFTTERHGEKMLPMEWKFG